MLGPLSGSGLPASAPGPAWLRRRVFCGCGSCACDLSGAPDPELLSGGGTSSPTRPGNPGPEPPQSGFHPEPEWRLSEPRGRGEGRR
ncbi:Hypothetical predicted protein [Marmota monax]|uniref:Uncharacterized protein n=1 Tax=Marmota monax TaxID=9995 RepID=A0A5E4D5R5_MARMO|nr:Hypothetical predicted protein [Marmota monax]